MKNESDKYSEFKNLSYLEWKAQMDELNRQLAELWAEIEADPWIQECLDLDIDDA